MAGDMQRAPSHAQVDYVLTEDNLGVIYEKLFDARTEWFDIGLSLGMNFSNLKAINKQCRMNESDVCKACLREMLGYCLHDDSSITWKKLCTSLKSPTVNRDDVAEKIEDWIKDSQGQSQNQEGQIVSPKFELRRKRSHSGGHESQDQKRSLIEVDLRDIKNSLKWKELQTLFKDLTRSVRNSLLNQKILPYQLSDCLVECYEDEPILKPDDSKPVKIFRHIKEEFDEKDSMEKFWVKIQNFISFFSFKLLKVVINSEYIDNSIKENLTKYEEEFRKISLSIVKHIVGEKGMKSFLPSDGTTKVIVKIQKKFTSYSDEHLETFKFNLASAIKMAPDHLHLIDLKPGCTLLTYKAPLYIEAAAFPLQPYQEDLLRRLEIIWLKCGNYQFPSNMEGFDPPDFPDSDDDYPAKSSQTIINVSHKSLETTQGSSNHSPSPGKEPTLYSTHTDDETVSQKSEPSVVLVDAAENVIKVPAPQSDSGHGSIVSIETGFGTVSRASIALTASRMDIMKGFSIHSDSGLGPSTAPHTNETSSIGQIQNTMEYINSLGEEYHEVTHFSKTLFGLKMLGSSLIEDKSICILHEIMVCCQFISNVIQMKAVEDEQCTAFSLAMKSGNLEQIKTIKDPSISMKELEHAVCLAAQAGHLNLVIYLTEECSVNLACETVSGATPLHIAACNGDEKLVEYILTQGIDPLYCNQSLSITPLHCACISGNLNVVKALVKSAMPYETSKESEVFLDVGVEVSKSLLHCAVWAQNLTIVQYLINELNASYSRICSEGLPPFFLAIVTGNLELVKYFTSLIKIDVGETIQRQSRNDNISESIAPVHVASFCGHEMVLKHLIAFKTCNPVCRLYHNGATALHLAISNGHLNCVNYLLESVSEFRSISQTISPALFWEESKSSVIHLNIDKTDESKSFTYSEMYMENINKTSDLSHKSQHLFYLLSSLKIHGNQRCAIFSLLTKMGYEHSGKNDEHLNSPLHYASMYGDLEAVKYIILELGVSPNYPNKHNVLPVHVACMKGQKDIVEFLFQLKQASNHKTDKNKWTVLHYAAIGGHLSIVSFLTTEQNCDVACKDVNGYSPAAMAANAGHLSILKFFVKDLNMVITDDRTNKGKLAIHLACQRGHLSVVKYLIEECGCDRMGIDNLELTPLHYAAANGHNDILEYLYENGCDFACRNIRGDTPLHFAAYHGHLKAVKLLIDSFGCEKENRTVVCFTALHYAAMNGHLSVVRYLTSEKKCNILCQESREGNTPAQLAVYKGHLEIVKFFCTDEVGYNASNDKNNVGRRPIHYACLHGSMDMVRFLVENCNCNINSEDEHSLTPMHYSAIGGHVEVAKYLYKRGCNAMCKTKEGQTPLHLAVGFGRIEMIKTLVLEIQCDIETKTYKNHTPLHYAAATNQLFAVQCLTNELKCDIKCKDIDGHSPVHWATSKGNLNIVKFFVEKLHYDLNSDKNKYGQTAIHCACTNGHLDMVKYLVEAYKCNLMSEDDAGFTPLHFAVTSEHTEVIAYLFNKGSNLMHKNKLGETGLHLAARLEKFESLKFLIQNLNCDKEDLTSDKRTPLHIAANVGHLRIVEYLATELKCQTMCRDKHGYTSAHLAVIDGHLDILKFFATHYSYDVNSDWNDLGQLPIHSACIKDHISTIKYLIEQCSADKMSRAKLDGSTPLHFAASCGHNHLIGYLHSLKCNINETNSKGETPLHLAAKYGMVVTVKYIINDLYSDREPCTSDGQTPLHYAAIEGHENVVEYLTKDLNCNWMCRDKFGYTPAQIAILKGQLQILKFFVNNFKYDVNSITNSIGQLAIHTASLVGHLDIVKYLVEECHCKLNCKDAQGGNTPLHLAVENKKVKIIEYLISKGSNKNTQKSNGFTPIHIAVSMGHITIVKYLAIKFRCNIVQRDAAGSTPGHLAAILGYLDILKFFTEICKYPVKNDVDYSGMAILHSASMNGHIDIVKYLVEELRCNPMVKDKKDNTPLHYAAATGQKDIIKYFIKKGCNVTCKNSLGETLIHLAADNGHLETVQMLISDLNCDREAITLNRQTPLHYAAANGHLPIVRYLTTEFNFNVVCKSRAGNSPAHQAVADGHLEILDYFVTNFNYNVNDDQNNKNLLPIHTASLNGHTDIVKYILEECSTSKLSENDAYQALVIAVIKKHHDIIACLLSNGYNANHKIENGVTILHIAADRGQLETVQFLIMEMKCNENAEDNHNQTPLHHAATEGYLSVVKYLTTELSCDILQKDSTGDTPAHCAVINGHLEVVKFCVDELGYNAHIDRNNQSRLPIHSASVYGHGSVLKYLVEELGCDVMSKDDSGTLPMHYAAASGRNAIIKLLKGKNCSVNCRNNIGDTPLHVAAEYGNVETVKLFICTLNCDRNVRNYTQHTPLHNAASKGNLPVVRLLTAELHCDIMSKDKDGDTPLQCAIETGKIHVAKYFVEKLNYDIHSVHNNLHRYALHYAALMGHLPIVKYLISQKANPFCKDVFQNLPLHYAAAIGHYQIVQHLLANGSPASARGIMGRTAADIAKINGHSSIQNLLDYCALALD